MKINEHKLADFVSKHPCLLNFLDRLDIELGFGDATIDEISKMHGIDSYFFTELLSLIIRKYEFNSNYYDRFELNLTVKYLKNSHKSYLEEYIPKLRNQLKELMMLEIERQNDCKLLFKYFSDYEAEFEHHLNDEDTVIYPYVLKLAEIKKDGDFTEQTKLWIINNSISIYLKKHDSLDEQLSDLKSLIVKYFKPFNQKEILRSFLKTIYELEEDLKLHELIENQILFKQAKKIEDELLSQVMVNVK